MLSSSATARCILFAFLVGMISAGWTAPVQFTIDSAQTQVTFSGVAAGLTIREQGTGSLTTSFEGYVSAELTTDTIRFVGGSRIDGLTNGVWSPKALGVEGAEPADFGAEGGSGVFLFGDAALRDLLLDLESATALPLSQESFAADGLLFKFPEDAPSAFDYRVTVFGSTQFAREFLAGYATNQVSSAATLTTEADTQVLVVPIDATVIFEMLAPGDSTLTITGQLRATRQIDVNPEIRIVSVRIEGILFTLEWTGAGDQPVRIESTTDWSSWSTVANLEPGITTWSVAPTGSASFFRVVQ